jgi:hypothetical protein
MIASTYVSSMGKGASDRFALSIMAAFEIWPQCDRFIPRPPGRRRPLGPRSVVSEDPAKDNSVDGRSFS